MDCRNHAGQFTSVRPGVESLLCPPGRRPRLPPRRHPSVRRLSNGAKKLWKNCLTPRRRIIYPVSGDVLWPDPAKETAPMLTILGAPTRFCDGLSRRSSLKIGGLVMGGLSLPELLRAEALSGISSAGNRHKAIIMVFLPGGPPHQDIFDLKPDA